jgi:hypothetical protein
VGSYTLPPFALYKPAISETGWGALIDTNYDLLAANSNAQLALGMFDYIITYGDVGDGNGVQARAINLRTYSVVAQNADYATVHNALVDTFDANGANVIVRSDVPVVPVTTSLRFNKFSAGSWTITPGQWVFGGRSFRLQATNTFTSGPNGSIMADLEAGGIAGTRGGKHIIYGIFLDGNDQIDTCILSLGQGSASGEGDANYLISPICIKYKRSAISYGTVTDSITTPPNGSANTWTFAAEIANATSGALAGFEFNCGDGHVMWNQVQRPGLYGFYVNAIHTTVIGGHTVLDPALTTAAHILVPQGSNFTCHEMYFDNFKGQGAVAVVPINSAGGFSIGIAPARVRIADSHFNMNTPVPIFNIDNANASGNMLTFTLQNANAVGQSSAHASAIVNFKDLRGSGNSVSVATSNAIASSMMINGGVFNNFDNIYTISGTTDAAARPTIGRINFNGDDMSQVPIKAGVPVDADYTQAFDGLQVLDTTGGKQYVRVGGVWTALN